MLAPIPLTTAIQQSPAFIRASRARNFLRCPQIHIPAIHPSSFSTPHSSVCRPQFHYDDSIPFVDCFLPPFSISMDIVPSRLAPTLRLLLVLIGTAVLGAPGNGNLQAAEAPLATVELGIGGKLKVGSWTPIHVELRDPLPQDAEIVVTTSDFENNRLKTPLVAKSPTQLTGLVQVGGLEGRVAVVLRQPGKESVLEELRVTPEGMAAPASYRQSTEFWGVLGSSARFEESATQWTASLPTTRGQIPPARAAAITLEWSGLPEAVEGWDSLDVLVIGADAYQIPPEKNETLRRWVERGGRLLLLLGSATGAYQKSPLAEWSPIAVEKTVGVTSLEMVKQRVSGSAPLRLGLRRSIPAAHLPGAPEGTLPGAAVYSKPYGAGFVSAFAFDFEQPPLSTWESQPELLRQLTMPLASAQGRANRESDLSSTGITDLASQMASGLDRFQGVNRASFRGVMLWTAFWMAVLFPLDYLIVQKVLKRPHLTWITLPFLIAIATLLASRSAVASNTAPLTVNQIDLVDFTPADAGVRVQSWMTFYSPETARYDLSATSPLAGEARLAWNAKPEEGLRGLYRQGGMNFGSAEFRTTADHTKIEELPVRMWSSYSLLAESNRERKGQPPLFESSLTESDAGRLQGSVTHQLPGPLRDWVIVYKNFLYHPVPARGELTVGEWKPGQAWRPGFDGQSTIARVYLQGHRMTLMKGQGKDSKFDQPHLEVTPYDASEFDPGRLMPMLSFHDAAQGAAYTGLANTSLAKLDLSRTVDPKNKGIDCAVVMGRLEAPAMSYVINGERAEAASSWTFVRSVLPVKGP
jgi:hypothetical protein